MSGKRTRVALVLDHPQRDLPGIVLVALELCRRGITCYLVPLNVLERELWSLAPDFVLMNYTRRGKERLVTRLLEAGIEFGLLDTEGLVADGEMGSGGILEPKFQNYTELLWEDAGLRGRASVACMWGPRLAEHLAEGGWFTPEQLVVTGCPRFDFYHPLWRSVFDDSTTREGTRRILINTWYPLVNSRLVSAATNEKQLREVLEWPEERIQKYFDDERAAIRGMIDLAGRLAVDYPKADILVRPHPFENDAVYRSGLSTFRNVRVNGDGPVHPQIFGASVLIARSCTTAIEAGMANVPSLSPQWVPTPSTSPISEGVSIPCEDYGFLRDRIGEILAGRFRRSAAQDETIGQVLSAWCHRNDGLAHQRVCDAIVGRLRGERRVDEALCARFLREYEDSQKESRRGWKHTIRRIFGISSDWSFRKMKSVAPAVRVIKRFGPPEIQGLAAKINAALERQGKTPVALTVRPSGGDGSPSSSGSLRSMILEQS